MEKPGVFAYYDNGDRAGHAGGLDRVRAFEVLTKECGPRQPVLPDLSRGDLLQVSQAFIVRQVLKLLQATLKARVNGLGSGTCLFLGIMSLDKEGGARHKQMDQEHVLEQVRPRFIDLTADKVTAHRVVRVIMRGHAEKLGCFLPTPKGAVERGQKDVHNMFNGLQGLCRKPQGDITTLQVQQLRLPFNRAEAGKQEAS